MGISNTQSLEEAGLFYTLLSRRSQAIEAERNFCSYRRWRYLDVTAVKNLCRWWPVVIGLAGHCD